MKTKKLSRALALVLCAVILAAVAAGCKTEGDEQASDDYPSYEDYPPLASVGHEETVSFTMLTWANRQIWPTRANNRMLDGIKQKFNVELDVKVVDTNYIDRLGVLAVNGELPDAWVSTLPWQTEVTKWVKADLMLCLDPYLDMLPNYFEVRSDISVFWDPLRVDGKLYCLPAVDNPNDCGPMIRKDWLDNLGLDIPKTPEELAAVLKAFTFDDPDGNGVDDTYGGSIFSGGLQYTIAGVVMSAYDAWFDMWYIVDGQPVYGFTRPEFLDALKFLRRLIFDDKSVSLRHIEIVDGSQIQSQNMAGNIGCMNFAYQFMTGANPMYQQFQKNTDDKGVLVPFEPLTVNGKQGTIKANEPIPFNRLCLNSEIKNPERLLEVMDWIMSEEGAAWVQYGFEGYHYDKGEDGAIKFKGPYTDGVNIYKEGFDEQFMLFGMRDLWGKHLDKPALDGAAILRKFMTYYPVYNVELTGLVDYHAAVNTKQTTFLMDAISLQNFDIDAEFENAVSAMYSVGLDRLTEEARGVAISKGLIK